tara:strand:- start:2404 stop:3264 length:861 start_codon:yes stop_codon:yes gene_type:complete
MYKSIKKITQTIKDSFNFIAYLIWLVIKYPLKTKLNKRSGKLVIIANGPSVKSDIENIKKNKGEAEFMVMNYMALDDVFYELKPEHYCFVDPMFFQETHRKNEAQNLFSILNEKVDWKLTIYIPIYYASKFNSFSNLKNKNINVIVINNCKYMGFEKSRNYFYKLGLSCPEIYSVVSMGIYIGIKSEYDCLNLYGVEHTFFDNLQVNEQNQLCAVYNHFYQSIASNELKPIKKINTGEVWKVSDYIIEKGLLFKSHDQLNSFAEYMGISIINCTVNSLIDSYDRLD